LTRQQALRLYTSAAAWVTFDEGDRGTIEPGRLADLAVLDQPYLTIADGNGIADLLFGFGRTDGRVRRHTSFRL
jgi:predicted amidohydrolase YtcJ